MDAPARLVVLAPNWLGDAVMALPAIADAAAARGRAASLAVAARGGLAPLFDGGPGRRRGGRPRCRAAAPVGRRRMPRPSARERFDARAAPAQLVPRRAGRAGAPGSRSAGATRPTAAAWLLTRRGRAARRRAPAPGGLLPATSRAALGIAVGTASTRCSRSRRRRARQARTPARAARLARRAARRARAGRRLRLAPSAGRPIACGRARGAPGAETRRARACIVGAAADRETAADVIGAPRAAGVAAGASIDLTGRTDLPTLVGVLAALRARSSRTTPARCTSPRRSACRSSRIFGPTASGRPRRCRARPAATPCIVHTDVWCRPCMLRDCPIDHRCMTGIAVETVLGAGDAGASGGTGAA